MSKKTKKSEIIDNTVVSSGDFIRVEFTGKKKSSGVVFSTTNSETAKNLGIFDDKTKYGPIPIVAGQAFLLPGLDKQIIGLKIGETKTIKVPSAEAYGPKSEDLIVSYPVRKLKASNIKPVKGEKIKDKNRVGTIVSIKEGRARVDYNHELAGEDLEFEISVVEKVEELKSKLFMTVTRYVPGLKEEDFKYEIDQTNDKAISLELSPYLLLTEGLQNVTLRLISDLRQIFTYEKIQFNFSFDFTEINKEEKKLAEVLTSSDEVKETSVE